MKFKKCEGKERRYKRLSCFQRNTETAARMLAYGCRGEVHSKHQEESTQLTSQESQSRATIEMLPGTRKEEEELYVKEPFTEDRDEWQKELQRHCEEVYIDQEETKEAQESRIEYFKIKGNHLFTVDWRSTEITVVDLVLQARAKLSGNKINGPEDAIVSEMIKRLRHGENLHCCEVVSGTNSGLVFLREPAVAPKNSTPFP